MEVKNAMLRTWEGGTAVLILVDEDYEIHSVSGDIEMFRVLMLDVELPNFIRIHTSNRRAYYADGVEYKGLYGDGKWLSLLDQYRKKDNVV